MFCFKLFTSALDPVGFTRAYLRTLDPCPRHFCEACASASALSDERFSSEIKS